MVVWDNEPSTFNSASTNSGGFIVPHNHNPNLFFVFFSI